MPDPVFVPCADCGAPLSLGSTRCSDSGDPCRTGSHPSATLRDLFARVAADAAAPTPDDLRLVADRMPAGDRQAVDLIVDTLDRITTAIAAIGEAIVAIDVVDDIRDRQVRDLAGRVELLEQAIHPEIDTPHSRGMR